MREAILIVSPKLCKLLSPLSLYLRYLGSSTPTPSPPLKKSKKTKSLLKDDSWDWRLCVFPLL
jgi:hypothetical protein